MIQSVLNLAKNGASTEMSSAAQSLLGNHDVMSHSQYKKKKDRKEGRVPQ